MRSPVTPGTAQGAIIAARYRVSPDQFCWRCKLRKHHIVHARHGAASWIGHEEGTQSHRDLFVILRLFAALCRIARDERSPALLSHYQPLGLQHLQSTKSGVA
jgi:hypothetical protein